MEALGTIQNPYNQIINPAFGKGNFIPTDINNQYKTNRGNLVNAFNPQLQNIPSVQLPATITKAGISLNQNPEQLPNDLNYITRPQYSSVSSALIEQPRLGVQLGAADPYRDDPLKDWTTGIQYYSIYVGDSMKTRITPVIYPQLLRPSEWAQDTVNFPEVNRQDTEDLTPLRMDYSCKSCNVPSSSLGSPTFYSPRVSNAPLPVAKNIGEWPNIGFYTARELGSDSRNWPPATNPIVDLQLINNKQPVIPVQAEYGSHFLNQLTHGFQIV